MVSSDKAAPGKMTIHHAVKFSRASNISDPQVSVPAGTPTPKKESPVSTKMADATP